MNIALLLGQTAGLIAFLSVKEKHRIISVVAYDNQETYKRFGVTVYASIKDEKFITDLDCCDMLLCVHGREIIPETILKKVRHKINVHPFLESYPGKSPVQRALEDRNQFADVTAHKLTSKIDSGEVIFQEKKVIELNSVPEIYNQLYPLYALVVHESVSLCETTDKNIFVEAD